MRKLEITLERLKAEAPLTLVVTNQVTVGDCANALLAAGAAPVMSADPEDAAELAALAGATVLNIGTVNAAQLEVLAAAGRAAKAAGRPVTLDPVGAGATAVRRRAAAALLRAVQPDIVRGNWAEIQALAGLEGVQRGVDAQGGEDLAAVGRVAGELAGRLGAVIAVTGAVDTVAAAGRLWLVEGGSPLLTRLTGTGCLLSALTGAYAAVSGGDAALAALAALSHLALAGEWAAEAVGHAPALGSFKTALFDALARVSPADLGRRGRALEK